MNSQSGGDAKEGAGEGVLTFGEVIHSYTRAQAIEDGYLVEVTATAKEAGFRWPVALTRAAWEDCVAWSDEDTRRKGVPQDEAGRLWDVLWMTRFAIRRRPGSADAPQVRVLLHRVPRDGSGTRPRLVELRAECHGGDAGEPVVTIMLPGED